MQPHAARFEQQHDGVRPFVDRALQHAHQLGAVDFADRAAHEAALLRRAEHDLATELAAPDDDAIVERDRRIELRQVRTDDAH